jgi:sigma-B regulation protein RsbU (phosphoserine phosphatase)
VSAQPDRVGAEPDIQQLRKLTEIGRALTYTTSLEQVAQLAVERGARLLGAGAAVLMLPDPDDVLHVRAAHGVPEERLTRGRAALASEMMEPLPELLGVSSDRLLGVPLVVGGAVTGLIAVALAAPPTPAEEWLLSALADQTAVALEHARLGGEVRLEMESRLRASEGATGVKDRALATLAHDIRSPLGAIDGYCWNLEDGLYGPVTTEQRKALERIRMSGRHLLSLLDNVMDMARLNAGVVAVNAEPVRLAAVAREAVDMLAPAAAGKLQSLTLAPASEPVIVGDADRLRQVLVNLISNAVKFTPESGSIAVTVSEFRTGGASFAEVRVTDSGPGIAEAERAAIFEPYYRSETVAQLPGVGLGLAISRALVEQMGGSLMVESEMGKGASFTIRFLLAGP